MSETVWKPRTTVAALCERGGKFLLVRENVNYTSRRGIWTRMKPC